MNELAIYLSQFGWRLQVPQVFIDLFAIQKKSDLVAFCKGLTVTEREFVELVLNCESIGYTHTRKWHEFMPEHLKLTEIDKNAFRSTGKPEEKARLGKVMNKISATFRERRHIVTHFFIAPYGNWHLIYLDLRDTDTEKDNHWAGGPHLHFVNHLWPQHDPEVLWATFDDRHHAISGAIHIAFSRMKETNW